MIGMPNIDKPLLLAQADLMWSEKSGWICNDTLKGFFLRVTLMRCNYTEPHVMIVRGVTLLSIARGRMYLLYRSTEACIAVPT